MIAALCPQMFSLRLLSPKGQPLMVMGPYTLPTALGMRADLLNVFTQAATIQLLDSTETVQEEMSRHGQ